MKFHWSEFSFSASVTSAEEETSARTGAALRVATIQFRAPKAEIHERALQAARACQQGGLISEPEGLEPELEWRVREASVAYVGSEPWGVHHHTWSIEQVERSACSTLHLADLQLEPYDYAEKLDANGALVLAARASANDQALERISGWHFANARLEVRREGISSAPRAMRIDAYVWGDGAHGQAVVVRCTDVREPRVALDSVTQPDALAGLVLALANSIDADALRQHQHAARRIVDADAWQL